jgi:Transposase DDE domain
MTSDSTERRGSRCSLIVLVDDVAGRLTILQFAAAETSRAHFTAWTRVLTQVTPLAFDIDQHGISLVNAKDVQNGEGKTKFRRVTARPGSAGLRFTMSRKVSAGADKSLMVPSSRLRWDRIVWAETPRIGEKNGTGRHLLVDKKGVPLGLTLVGANRHDVSQLEAVLNSKIAQQTDSTKTVAENLCADARYVGETADAIIRKHGYIPHVRPRGEEIKAKKSKRFKPRRWIVEVLHSRFNNLRKLKVRYKKATANCLTSPLQPSHYDGVEATQGKVLLTDRH